MQNVITMQNELTVSSHTALDSIRQLSASGLSQRKIAEVTGLGKSTINDLLKGRYAISSARGETVATKLTHYKVVQKLSNLHSQGLSVRGIASLSGLARTTVHNLLTGKRKISPAMADKAVENLSSNQGIRLFTSDGFLTVIPLRASDWSLIGKHDNAMKRYLDTGNPSFLQKVAGKTVKTTAGEFQLVTDPNVIKRFARQGALDIDDVVIGGSPGQKKRR